ncbi:MAG: hypothetical protein QHH07_12695 [Sedimentisphaerales bacterium]|nr:hypothetical protein [Sedimentisphaerales bacterium]
MASPYDVNYPWWAEDCSENPCIEDWDWSLGGGTCLQQYDGYYYSYRLARYHAPGKYYVTVVGTNWWGLSDWDFKRLYLFDIDLDVDRVPESEEADPGKFMCKGDTTSLSLLWAPSDLYSGELVLEAVGNSPEVIRVKQGTKVVIDGSHSTKSWPVSRAPHTLVVEAVNAGQVVLYLHYKPYSWWTAGSTGTLQITVVDVRILYPWDANGNGKIDDPWANEFSFDDSEPAILEIDCIAAPSPGADPSRYRWYIEDVGELRGIWSPHVPGNPYVGTGSVTRVRFTGMPSSNSAFGPKRITLTYEGLSCSDQETIEVFFDPLARNNPGPPPDSPPNDIAEEDLVE